MSQVATRATKGEERPKALDLFCKAGGASMGLHQAGFDVTGVDIEPQPHYPFRFIQGDVMDWLKWERFVKTFDFIWASPPCQAYAMASLSNRMAGAKYPDYISLVRSRLNESGIPFVIENVPGAPMRADLILCGSMFGLNLVRHRWFEFSFDTLTLTESCSHGPMPVTVVGHGTPSWVRERNGGKVFTIKEKREAMGIDWMNRGELSQAIPPAYSKYIGEFAIKHIREATRQTAIEGRDP